MNFVVYSHTRLDTNEIFYIGIGYLKRAYTKNSRNIHWKRIVKLTEYKVDILHDNLTWDEACKLEIHYIKLYGRRDKNLGPLVNMTDGGDGKIGYKFSDESKKKIGDKNRINFKGSGNPFFGRTHSDESKDKAKKTKEKNPFSPTLEQKEKWRLKMVGKSIHDDESINQISHNMPHQRPIDVWKVNGDYVGRWHAFSAFVREVMGYRARTDSHKQYFLAVSKICGILNGRIRNKSYKGYIFKDVMVQQETLQ